MENDELKPLIPEFRMIKEGEKSNSQLRKEIIDSPDYSELLKKWNERLIKSALEWWK